MRHKLSLLFLVALIVLGVSFADTNTEKADQILDLQITSIERSGLTDEGLASFEAAYTNLDRHHREIGKLLLRIWYDFVSYDEKSYADRIELLRKHPDLDRWPLAKMWFYDRLCNQIIKTGMAEPLLSSAFEMMMMAKEHGNKDIEERANYYIAYAYYLMINDTKAYDYFMAAKELAIQNDNPTTVSKVYRMLGGTEDSYGEYEKGDLYYKESLAVLEAHEGSWALERERLVFYLDYAYHMYESGNSEEAMKYIEMAGAIISPKDLRMQMFYNWNKGRFLLKDEKYLEADPFLKKAASLAEQIDGEKMSYDHRAIIGMLAQNEYYLGNFQSSADLYILLEETYDPQANIEQSNALSDTAFGLEEAKFEEKMALLTKLEESQRMQIASQRYYLIALSVALIFLVGIVVIIIIDSRYKRKTQNQLYQLSITDGLTNISNRSHIIQIFESKLNKQVMVAMLDVDHFKRVNDTYGHLVGDAVLIGIVETIQHSIRETDHIGRYGGEEFMIVFDGMSFEKSKAVAERLRENVENIQWPYEGLKTTLSIGLLGCTGDVMNGDAILQRVDDLLYEAKNKGRNRVVCALCDGDMTQM